MRDEAGFDEKIVAVPSIRLTKRYQKIENYTDLPEITLRQFEHCFGRALGDAAEARRIVAQSIERAAVQKET